MDWKLTISTLQQRGMTQPQIAAACGCAQSTISDLASGKTTDPRDSLGQKLRKLLRPDSDGGNGAQVDRRDPAAVNPFPDLDRRAPAQGC